MKHRIKTYQSILTGALKSDILSRLGRKCDKESLLTAPRGDLPSMLPSRTVNRWMSLFHPLGRCPITAIIKLLSPRRSPEDHCMIWEQLGKFLSDTLLLLYKVSASEKRSKCLSQAECQQMTNGSKSEGIPGYTILARVSNDDDDDEGHNPFESECNIKQEQPLYRQCQSTVLPIRWLGTGDINEIL